MILNTLTITCDKNSTNYIDLSKQYINSVISVSINGMLCKFYHNTTTKTLSLLHVIDKGDNIVITYYPNLSELRDKQLKVLGI
jgi:hypothetical protein